MRYKIGVLLSAWCFQRKRNQIVRWKPKEGGKINVVDKYYNDRRQFGAFLIENKF